VEIYNKFREKLEMPLEQLRKVKGPFLFGQIPTIVNYGCFNKIFLPFWEYLLIKEVFLGSSEKFAALFYLGDKSEIQSHLHLPILTEKEKINFEKKNLKK
jgi:hypothetical protein